MSVPVRGGGVRSKKVPTIPGRSRGGLDIVNIATDMDLRDLVPRTWEALKRTNNPVRLVTFGNLASRLRRRNARLVTEPLNTNSCRYEIEMHAAIRFVKGGKNNIIPTAAPRVLIDTLLAVPEPPLPPLDRIVSVPVYTAEGALLSTPGYDPHSRMLFDPGSLGPLNLPPLTAATVARARALILDDLLVDFPFVGPSERAHAVAALLLPFVRALIDGPSPLHLIEKPTPGAGATLLAEMLLWPALGTDVPRMTVAKLPDEQRWMITAALREGPMAVLIDNVPAMAKDRRERLDSEALSSAITGVVWSDRRIGSSELIVVPVSCVWLATGNNPATSQEIARRCVRIRIDPGVERPELRSGFKHPMLRPWVRQHRTDLIVAALTLVRAWIDAKRPAGNATLGMFESWSAVLGGILGMAEIDGFLGNVADLQRGTDDDGQSWQALVLVWWAIHRDAVVAASDLFSDAEQILDLNGSDSSRRTQFGNQLATRRDRVYSGYRIRRLGMRHGAATYKLEPAPREATSPHAPRPK
jgi:putative DNA primase/helicase